MTPYDRGSVALLAAGGDRLAKRLVAQEFLRDGQPGPALPLLLWCLASRPATAPPRPPSPPVEELLLAQAYLKLNQPEAAERFYRAATEWLDRPGQPIRAANIVSHSGLSPWAGLVAAVAPVAAPRRNLDWELWHECDVFLAGQDAPGRLGSLQQLIALSKRYPALRRGLDVPNDNHERLVLAQLACDRKHFPFATQLWAQALASDPKLGDDRQTLHRWHAARAAALAAAGQGKDEPALDDAAKAKLRSQALVWLKAELFAWDRTVNYSGPTRQQPIDFPAALRRWQTDSDLAGIRDADALAKLPAQERQAFRQLWAEVAAVIQVEEVRQELQKCNPGYNGRDMDTTKDKDGVVTRLSLYCFVGVAVHNVAPLRAFKGLTSLWIFGNGQMMSKSRLSDLTPLKGMPLTELRLVGCSQVRDLEPLQGMPLTSLDLNDTQVRDLSPLKGMRLTALNLSACGQVSDLTPLKDMPLTSLVLSNTQVRDLSPLKGMRLTSLYLFNCSGVRELEPLKGMPLTQLDIRGTAVTNLSPLKDLPLRMLNCDFQAPRDARILSAIKTLQWINGMPAEKFWEPERKKRIPALLRGEDKPADNAERLAFAQIAYNLKKFAFATRLWAEALASDPKLGDNVQAQHRYKAARAAALAAAGRGQDEPPLDDAAKAKLRRQASDWLKAELTGWGKLVEANRPQVRPFIVRPLSQWQKDSDLAGIRDAAALAKLPAEEQKALTQLWADVAELLKKAAEKPK